MFKNLSVLLLFCSLLLISGASTIYSSSASSQHPSVTGPASCPNLVPEVSLVMSSVDTAKAKSLADFNGTFMDLLDNWHTSITSSGCSVVLDSVVAVYNVAGKNPKIVEVIENPALTKVVSIKEYNETYHYPVSYSSNWAGYTISYYYSETPLVFVTANWYVPSSSEGYNGECDLKHCDMAVWPGQTAQAGGGNGIAQAGTDSGTYCAFGGCSSFYSAWIEFYPAGSQSCSVSVSPGNNINTYTDDDGGNINGAPNSNYQAFVYNNANGQGCSSSTTMSMGLSYYVQFIAEDVQDCNGYGQCSTHLPKFSEVTFFEVSYCYVGYCLQLQPVNNPSGQNTLLNQMNNGQGNNTWESNIFTNSGSGFYVKWITSAGT